jgi:hypothetical protein
MTDHTELVLVPREPTDAMVMAGDACCPITGTNGMRRAYKAMIASAPPSQPQQVNAEHLICEHGRDAFADDCGMCDRARTNNAMPERADCCKKVCQAELAHGGACMGRCERLPDVIAAPPVARANAGAVPCKGKNCGSTNYRFHSADCFAEHEAIVNPSGKYDTRPPSAMDVQTKKMRDLFDKHDRIREAVAQAGAEAWNPVCYTTDGCEKHHGQSWTTEVMSVALTNKLCPLCHPARPPAAMDAAKVREILAGALERMDRARRILTNDKPTWDCNWGVLDTSDIRAALASAGGEGRK